MTEPTYRPSKPTGFVPAVQRYSATLTHEDPSKPVIMVQIIGAQSPDPGSGPLDAFSSELSALSGEPNGPVRIDHARYVDEAGYPTHLAFAYWPTPTRCDAWWKTDAVASWWEAGSRTTGTTGYFVESIQSRTDALETIAFKEYIQGLSACPMSRIEPMGESGYWGAARDRIARSGFDRFDPPDPTPLQSAAGETRGQRLRVLAPANHCVIRSGVSWAACGDEQLTSYRTNVLPRLNEGMEYLRSNPIDSGCWALRQVEVVDTDGQARPESWVAGHFVSLADLERWAHKHPTHLAIFGQAQKERTKYQENLELRTYHEVYIVEEPQIFEYVNCHPRTGALNLLPTMT